MLLEEAVDPKQVKGVIERGDPQLEDDVRRQLSDAFVRAYDNALSEWDDLTKEELVARVEARFDGDLANLVDEFEPEPQGYGAEEVLRAIPKQQVRDALRTELETAGERLERWHHEPRHFRGHPSSTLFEFDGGRGPGIEIGPIYHNLRVVLDEPLSWVPDVKILEVLKDEGPYDAQWEEIDEGEWDTGWIESGDQLRLEIKHQNVLEWAQDLRGEYYSQLVDADPAEAIAALRTELEAHYPTLATKVKKAKLPKDVLADYAVAYFQDPEEGIELLSEATGAFGYEGTRAPTILEIDENVLRQLGVRHDRWEHGAPWRLVDLPPEELAYEGTLQRHCVGRHGMGYKEAVQRGETAIWSLRSKFDRPLLTFEIARRQWESAKDSPSIARRVRAGAIAQVKGKLNRPPGKDEDEEVVLEWIFDQLGVDPAFVRDYSAPRAANPTPSFCAPWRPYRERNVTERPRANPRVAALKQRLENPWAYGRQVSRLKQLPREQQANLYGAMQALSEARRRAIQATREGRVGEAKLWRDRADQVERDVRGLERAYGLEVGAVV